MEFIKKNIGDIISNLSGGVDNPANKPDSPCIGMCSTSYGDDICRGCGRTFIEVIDWIIYEDEQKKSVWMRVEEEGTSIRFRKN
jgi:predicted Fe-S protein YdhL (DUF1289 family)